MNGNHTAKYNRFANQVVTVTGAASGIGAGIVKLLASEGAAVALLDNNEDGLTKAVGLLRSDGIKAQGFVVDVGEERSVCAAVEQIERDLGPSDVMINCAGIVGMTNKTILDYSFAEFERVQRVNLGGSFLMTKYSLPAMLKRRYGRILLIASIAGKEGNPFMSGYTCSKAGVIGLVKGIAKEYAESGVTVNGLAPAVVLTDLVRGCDAEQVEYMTSRIPMKRCGTIDEVASMSAWIVSPECSFTTGFVFDLSGGRATY